MDHSARRLSLVVLFLFGSNLLAQLPPPVWETPSSQPVGPFNDLPLASPDIPNIAADRLPEFPSAGKPQSYRLFIDLDLAAAYPQIRTRNGGTALGGAPTDFRLDGDVQPTFTLGYNLPGGLWSVFASYRYLGASGHAELPGPLSGQEAQTRLDVNDFIWAVQRRFEPTDRWHFAFYGGARLADVFYDLNATGIINIAATAPEISFDAHGSSEFLGGGPFAGLGSELKISPTLTLFATTDFSALFGQQTFRTGVDAHKDGLPPYMFHDTTKHSPSVKVLRAEAGLSWAPVATPHMQFQFGYRYEYWWDIGKYSGGARDDLLLNEFFARVRFAF